MPQAAAEGFRLNWQWVRQICFPWRLCCPESPEAVKSLTGLGFVWGDPVQVGTES